MSFEFKNKLLIFCYICYCYHRFASLNGEILPLSSISTLSEKFNGIKKKRALKLVTLYREFYKTLTNRLFVRFTSLSIYKNYNKKLSFSFFLVSFEKSQGASYDWSILICINGKYHDDAVLKKTITFSLKFECSCYLEQLLLFLGNILIFA